MPSPVAPFLAFSDEMSYYSPFANDPLKEQLRALPGVPNAKYLVRDGKVFVFERLVAAVSAAGLPADGKVDAEQVARLMPQAWVDPDFAVASLGVVPEPFKLIDAGGSVAILHEPFNALLPGSYATKEAAQSDLVKLLLGDVVPGAGQFEYRRQPMTLRHTFDMKSLPTQPIIDVAHDGQAPFFSSMTGITFEPGLPLLSENTFANIARENDKWGEAEARAQRMTRARANDVWKDAAGYSFTALNDSNASVPDYGLDDSVELRQIYPELSMLDAASLYWLYDGFANDCLYLHGWSPAREDDFLFYLLGELALGPVTKGEVARDAGLMAGFALLSGRSVADALAFGVHCVRYQSALGEMASRARTAMRFLAEEKDAPPLQGSKISTLGDLMRLGRKFGATVVPAQQSLSDFDGDAVNAARHDVEVR